MGVSVTTPAETRRLARVKAVQDVLGITSDNDLIADMLDRATAVIEHHCRWPLGFGRQVYSETLPGFGGVHLMLAERPIVAVSSVTYDGDAITDHSILERDTGLLYRKAGWTWTVQREPALTGWQRWPGLGVPLPGQEEPLFTVAYTAGYILPSQDLVEVSISAAAAGDTFDAAGGEFPSQLVAGDIVETSGFTNAANNGRHVVTGTPSTTSIPVTTALTTEAAGARTIRFKNLPETRSIEDLEHAAVLVAKGYYESRKDDPRLIEKSLGPARLRWSELESVQSFGVPAEVVGILRPWVRFV